MCGKKEEDEGECSQAIHSIQGYQDEQLLIQQQQQQQKNDLYGGSRGGLIFPEVSPILPVPWSLPPVHTVNPALFTGNPVPDHVDPFLVPPLPSSYEGLFNRRAPALKFAYDGSSSDHLRILSNTPGPVVQPAGSAPFGLQAELGKMTTAQQIMDAKALAASKSHSEAERRRRERINNHLAKLRSLLPSTTKTDKASLLAEVIQHVKELKRQTCLIAETSPVPTEIDELTVDTSDEDGKFVIKASLCCEDRSDLLADLIKTLKALRLKTLKAEITTLGGRVKNVLFITGEEESSSSASSDQQQQYCISSIQEALKAVMEKASGDESSSGLLVGWWSIDEGSREEQAKLYCSGTSGYNTFSPDIVKNMPKSDLVEENWRLQAALSEQTEVTKYSQQEFERLQYEKILCRVCFEEQINVVLLPCRHYVLCSTCCEKCKRCPICRVSIEERLPVYDV